MRIEEDFALYSDCLVILGGTFDPIHNGHLAIANGIYSKLGTKVTFMPTITPPYKSMPETTNEERLAMLEIALDESAKFVLNTFEIRQSEYWCSYRTLTFIRDKLGSNIPILFLIGGDSLLTLDSWDNWQKLFDLVNFGVIARPGYKCELISQELRTMIDERRTVNCSDLTNPNGKVYFFDLMPYDISSTKIRSMVKANLKINELVPEEVALYIKKHKLYEKNTKRNISEHKTNHPNCN